MVRTDDQTSPGPMTPQNSKGSMGRLCLLAEYLDAAGASQRAVIFGEVDPLARPPHNVPPLDGKGDLDAPDDAP